MPRFGEIGGRYKLGPRRPPRPGERAPHKDVGQLTSDFIRDMQSVGEDISDTLDEPFRQTVGIEGPHRVVGGLLSYGAIMSREAIERITRAGIRKWPW